MGYSLLTTRTDNGRDIGVFDSDVACERACAVVLFFAPFSVAKEVATLHSFGFEVFGVVMSSVLPFNARAKGFISEKGEIEVSDRDAKVASFVKPVANSEIKRTQILKVWLETLNVSG